MWGRRRRNILRDGEAIGSVSVPVAVDADGREVPSKYDLSGNELAVSVDRGSAEFQYPLLVDPTVAERHLTDGNGQPKSDCSGWWSGSGWRSGSTRFSYAENCDGLYINTRAGVNYAGYEAGEWSQFAIRKSYFESVQLYANHWPGGDLSGRGRVVA